jgi:hypothetical protein
MVAGAPPGRDGRRPPRGARPDRLPIGRRTRPAGPRGGPGHRADRTPGRHTDHFARRRGLASIGRPALSSRVERGGRRRTGCPRESRSTASARSPMGGATPGRWIGTARASAIATSMPEPARARGRGAAGTAACTRTGHRATSRSSRCGSSSSRGACGESSLIRYRACSGTTASARKARADRWRGRRRGPGRPRPTPQGSPEPPAAHRRRPPAARAEGVIGPDVTGSVLADVPAALLAAIGADVLRTRRGR